MLLQLQVWAFLLLQGIVEIMNALTPEEQETLARLSRKLGLGS